MKEYLDKVIVGVQGSRIISLILLSCDNLDLLILDILFLDFAFIYIHHSIEFISS